MLQQGCFGSTLFIVYMDLKIEYVAIGDIKPYENNAKEHPQEQVEQIKQSILEFGMNDPIAICRGIVVEGHGRLLACKELGFAQVPVIKLDHLTENERKAYTLVHNKLTMNSGFDFELLTDELLTIADIDMGFYGFDIEVEEVENGSETEETPVNEEAPTRCNLGEIWKLGRHRLMCGDATNMDAVQKLLGGGKWTCFSPILLTM